LSSLSLGGVLITLGYSAGRKTTIDVTDLIWKGAQTVGYSLFAQSPTDIDALTGRYSSNAVGETFRGKVNHVFEAQLASGWTGASKFGYCRDTSEPGLALLIYRRSGRGSRTRCSVFLRAVVSDHSGLSANRAGVLDAQSWRLIIVWLDVRVLPATTQSRANRDFRVS